MKESNFTFGKKMTIAEFKNKTFSRRIDIKTNPKTGKNLMINEVGIIIGYVSPKCNLTQPVVISELISNETGDIVKCMHNPGISNIEAITSF